MQGQFSQSLPVLFQETIFFLKNSSLRQSPRRNFALLANGIALTTRITQGVLWTSLKFKFYSPPSRHYFRCCWRRWLDVWRILGPIFNAKIFFPTKLPIALDYMRLPNDLVSQDEHTKSTVAESDSGSTHRWRGLYAKSCHGGYQSVGHDTQWVSWPIRLVRSHCSRHPALKYHKWCRCAAKGGHRMFTTGAKCTIHTSSWILEMRMHYRSPSLAILSPSPSIWSCQVR